RQRALQYKVKRVDRLALTNERCAGGQVARRPRDDHPLGVVVAELAKNIQDFAHHTIVLQRGAKRLSPRVTEPHMSCFHSYLLNFYAHSYKLSSSPDHGCAIQTRSPVG